MSLESVFYGTTLSVQQKIKRGVKVLNSYGIVKIDEALALIVEATNDDIVNLLDLIDIELTKLLNSMGIILTIESSIELKCNILDVIKHINKDDFNNNDEETDEYMVAEMLNGLMVQHLNYERTTQHDFVFYYETTEFVDNIMSLGTEIDEDISNMSNRLLKDLLHFKQISDSKIPEVFLSKDISLVNHNTLISKIEMPENPQEFALYTLLINIWSEDYNDVTMDTMVEIKDSFDQMIDVRNKRKIYLAIENLYLKWVEDK